MFQNVGTLLVRPASVDALLPLLIEVAQVGHHKGRVMAARALAAVVPSPRIATCVQALLGALPTDAVMGAPFSKPLLGREPDEFSIQPSVHLNALDGTLLQLNHLLALLAPAPTSSVDPRRPLYTGGELAGADRVAADVLGVLEVEVGQRRWLVEHLGPCSPLPRTTSTRHPVPSGFIREKIVVFLSLWRRLVQRLGRSVGASAVQQWAHPVLWCLRILDGCSTGTSDPAAFVDPGQCLELATCASVVVNALVQQHWEDCVAGAAAVPPSAPSGDDALAALVDVVRHPSVDARASASLQLKRSLRALVEGAGTASPIALDLFRTLRGYYARGPCCKVVHVVEA